MDQFIRIPETHLPTGLVVPPFAVGTYLCSKGPDGRAAVTAEGKPWTRITYADAVQACAAAGYELLCESQWLALAWTACRYPDNWAGYASRSRVVLQGIRKGRLTSPQPGLHNPEHMHEHRWLRVTHEHSLCDLNGNAWQWVFDDIQGDRHGLTGDLAADSPSLTTQPHPSHTHGMGWSPYPGKTPRKPAMALARGGGFMAGKDAGIFGLQCAVATAPYVSVGFRCTRPIA